jgi:hypothetical protein
MSAVKFIATYDVPDNDGADQLARPVYLAKPVTGDVDIEALNKSVRDRTKKARAILAR